MQEVQAYIESLRFGPMLEWLSRGYYATDVGVNEIDYSVVLYRKTKVLSKPTTSALALNHSRLRPAIGGAVASDSCSRALTVVGQRVWGLTDIYQPTETYAKARGYPLNAKVYAISGRIRAGALSRVFAEKINVGGKHTYQVEASWPLGTIFEGDTPPTDQNLAATLTVPAAVTRTTENTVVVKPSTKDWPLIEGPSVMTYGEVIVGAEIDFTAIFCNNADVAEAIRAGGARYSKDVSTLDIVKRCDERPFDGFCYFRNGTSTLNPLSLIPEMAAQADDILAGDLTIDGVDYSNIRTKWGPGAGVVGAYTSSAIDTSSAGSSTNLVLAELRDTDFAAFNVDAHNVYTLADHDGIPAMGESEFNTTAILLIALGKTVSVGVGVATSSICELYAQDANARIANYAQQHRSVVVSYDGCGSNVGHMLCGALLTDQKSASVKLARGFVVPAYLTTV